MNILIVGSGGREHALAWKIRQSEKVKNIFVAPGNPGTAPFAQNIALNSSGEIVEWLKKNKEDIDLVVIGPDNYLAEGLVDEIIAIGIKVFGPTKIAAEIEWSKSFAKEFMMEEGIPTAAFKVFTDFEEAKVYLKRQRFPIVIKASGLAFGKGVIIAEDLKEAEIALDEILQVKIFGDAGNEVVIEEYMQGREISIHAFCDGTDIIMFPAAQDHKRIGEGDSGPNTGGMGTVVPVPWVTNEMLEDIKIKVVMPTIQALKRRGSPFVGILFPGVMMTEGGPKVIEFNARFGDPETQSYMRILKDDLVGILLACVEGKLSDIKVEWSNESACCVVLASEGYPVLYEKGKSITGIEGASSLESIEIFHAGTAKTATGLVTSGGRVLGITAVADNLQSALGKAYKAGGQIDFEGKQYRKDIGLKALS
ncbi:MAG: phosphoribosylamine--glycine ligase [Patescibacteria group bacterium]